jgi:hypothetical protein
LGHTKIESTVRYLRIEVDDALAIAGDIRSAHVLEAGLVAPAAAGLRPSSGTMTSNLCFNGSRPPVGLGSGSSSGREKAKPH